MVAFIVINIALTVTSLIGFARHSRLRVRASRSRLTSEGEEFANEAEVEQVRANDAPSASSVQQTASHYRCESCRSADRRVDAGGAGDAG